MLFVNWYAFELGEVLSFMVLPILLVALTAEVNDRIVSKYARNNKGFLLLLSLIWVTYSHFLTTLLCIIISLVVFVFVLIKNNLERRTLFRDVKLLIIYMLVTSFFWVNFLNAYLQERIKGPERYFTNLGIQQLFENSLSNTLLSGNFQPTKVVSIGLILMIGIIILGCHYQILTRFEKVMLNVGVISLILSTNLFSWNLINKVLPKILVFQSSFRFLILTVLVISVGLSSFINLNKHNLVILSLIIFIFNITAMTSFTESGKLQPNFEVKATINNEPQYANFKVNEHTFSNLFNGYYGETGGPADYLTTRQIRHFNSVANHKIIADGKAVDHSQRFITNGVDYVIKVNQQVNINLPIYKTHYKYIIYDNNRMVNHRTSSRGTLLITHVHRGKHHIKVRVKPTIMFMLSIITSLIGIIFILILKLKNINVIN